MTAAPGDTDYDSAIALIGMSGRFPGADGVAALWRNLEAGVSGLRPISAEELDAAGVTPQLAADPDYVAVGGPVAGLDLFDAAAFGMNPREAAAMEPQHRLFLECAWEALESAGYSPVEPGGRVGVFGGSAFPDYMIKNAGHLTTEPGGMLLLAVGNERDSLTSLVSYKLGLRGPAVTVQTFCSTSLVGVHLASQSLLTFECDMALAGGAFLPLPQPVGYRYEPGGILSPDGQVRSFDAAADGSVMGSGVGVVALKRMADAVADGDVIHAVILGSATNNDGRERVGYTAPGVDGQAEVIETALAVSGVKPESIGYVECHATGTQLGDSIELAAMTRAFPTATVGGCVLGSLKPSIGHLDRASGVTGLMRASRALRTATLPGVPGYDRPNPALAAAADRFRVLTEPRPWPVGDGPRRAGVSSFGLGGTNAHVVLEEAPARPVRPLSTGPHLLTLSANDATALDEVTIRLREHLAADPSLDLDDVAHTLQVSRGHFALRRTVIVHDHADALDALADPTRYLDGRSERRNPPLHLTAAPGDADWWSELAGAARRLLPDTETVAAPDPADPGLGALVAGLTALGITPGTDGATIMIGPDDGPPAVAVLTAVARAWLAGAAVDWPALHRADVRRVELPTYPFQRSRYWLDARPPEAAAEPEGRQADPTRWTYLPTWRQDPLPVAELDAQLRARGPWLVLAGDERGEALVQRLFTAGAEVVTARPGPEFVDDGSGDCVIRPASSQDMTELLRAQFVAPRTIVHALTLGTDPAGAQDGGAGAAGRFDAAQERGLHSVLALAGALADDAELTATTLVLLTTGTAGVIGSDLRHPEHATVAGVAASLAQEIPALSCLPVDIESAADLDQVLAAAVEDDSTPVAVRGAQAWRREYRPAPLSRPGEALFTAADTVLITGGLGDVGLVLARHLARTYGCRLVLTSRTPLPDRAEPSASVGSAGRAARHLRNIAELESDGAEVLAVGADVADRAQMQAVVDAAVARFGGIDVVVHAAGVQDPAFFGLAHTVGRDARAAHLRAKVHGLLVLDAVLDEVLGQYAPQRRITLSSVSAVLGGLALGPYAAANAALDAYALVSRREGRGRWVSVDWDTWGLHDHGGARTAADYEMSPEEGVDVFERALAARDRHAHLVISTGPLQARLEQWVTGGAARASQSASEHSAAARHPRPALATPFAEPAEGLEREIAEVWSATLALEGIGADDDFFELGGHSLIAIQLNARLRAVTAVALPVTALVEHPTVRRLARVIESARAAN